MPASRYDIYAEQGSTFKLHLQYKYSGGTGIDLSNFNGAIQVRRSSKDESVVLFITNRYDSFRGSQSARNRTENHEKLFEFA